MLLEKYLIRAFVKTVTTAETREKFQNMLSLFGISDRDIMNASILFKNTTFPKYLEKRKIKHHYVT